MFLCISPYSKAQTTKKVRKERKQLVKKYLSAGNQSIFFDGKPISVEDFYNIPQENIAGIDPYSSNDDDKSGKCESLRIFSTNHRDSVCIANRRGRIKSYRQKEMGCFYGSNEPLIMFGDRKINREEYYELAEDKVAFVNFYFSDFAKSYYGPEAKYGLVYVCPRTTKSSIVYDDGLPLPANGRNYIDDFSTLFGNVFDSSVRVQNTREINRKLNENQELKAIGCKATITVSCIVHTDGSIEPKIIENFCDYNEAADNNKDRLFAIVKDAISSLPNVDPVIEILYNKHLKDNVTGTREASFSVTVKVG